jgi:hypothetical protein
MNISGYQPSYLNGGRFVEKLIKHSHEKAMHLGVASTMSLINPRRLVDTTAEI